VAVPLVEKAPLLRPAGRRKPTKAKAPTLKLEKQLWEEGHDVVVGIDEVGRGAWAGPLAVGAAVLPKDRRVLGVRDSKMLTERERERLFDRVAGWCDAWGVGMASQEECDELGMAEAQRIAARRAVEQLGVEPDKVLLDGSWDFVGRGTTVRVIKGDATVLSIAAASILAKVTRDRLMREQAEHYPYWWFEDNKGYPCPKHKAVLQGMGPSAIHRRSWVFMDHIPWGGRLVREPTLF
jgi:ribonuclease HII